MLAILAPGQGSQTPGFLLPWLEVPGVGDQLRWYSEVVGRDLVALGTTGSAEDIRDTAACQPLLVAAGLATAHALLEGNDRPRYYAGHSVGELTAAALSGMISDEAAMVIARERGNAMALAAAATPTGMSACLGGDPDEVVAIIEKAGLGAANRNGAGQIVAAGALDALAGLADALNGIARVIPLKVAGAFHTDYMLSAQQRLEALAEVTPSHDAHVPMLSNADGEVVTHGEDMLKRLVEQVASPVRWDMCMETLVHAGVSAVVELSPAGTLTNLFTRAHKSVKALALKTPADLEAARALIDEDMGNRLGTGTAPPWRLILAPAGGTFEMQEHEVDVDLVEGAQLGIVSSRRGNVEVFAPYGGRLIEWLAHDGDRVKPGQPLARLHPSDAPE
ncbi:MAG: acyltransferase domain-containing protein [Actinomycetota bacterium]